MDRRKEGCEIAPKRPAGARIARALKAVGRETRLKGSTRRRFELGSPAPRLGFAGRGGKRRDWGFICLARPRSISPAGIFYSSPPAPPPPWRSARRFGR